MWKSIPDNGNKTRLATLILFVVGVISALVLTLPHSPANMPYVWPDGGVFLYVGQRMLDGAALYRQVWDHKPPLVYYLNALGLLLAQGSRWGVWGIETLSVAAATLLSIQLLRRVFGTALALLVTAIWMVTFFSIIEDGNLTETYALPLQFACLALAYDVESKRAGVYRWRGFFIGILLGLIFFLKLNEIGVGLAIGSYIVLKAIPARAWRRALIDLGFLLGGFALVTVIVLGVLAAQNSLYDFWRAAFVFNVIYSSQFEFWSSRFEALAMGYQYLVSTGLIVFALLGFVIGLNVLAFARTRIPPSLRPLLEICALALPIEVVAVTTTGRPFDHYFAALLYVLAVWAAYFFLMIFQAVRAVLGDVSPRGQAIAPVSIVILVALTLLPAVKQDVALAQTLHALEPPEIVRFLRDHTTPQDTVLILGHEARILFFAGRRSPTRFVNASTFQQTAFVTTAMAEEYYKDITDAHPAYIVDLLEHGLVNITPIDNLTIRHRIGTLNRLYKPYGRVAGWMVYAPAPTP